MGKKHPGGSTVLTPFKIDDPQPIVDYMVVEFVADLAALPNQFIGMETFVLQDQKKWIKKATGWEVLGPDQDNLIKEVIVQLPELFTLGDTVATHINNRTNFTASDKEILIITTTQNFALGGSIGDVIEIKQYFLKQKGKGSYGLGGTQLTMADLLLNYSNRATVTQLTALPTTQNVNLGDISGQNIWTVVNAKNPAITVQEQNVGYRLFNTIQNGLSISYLFKKIGGKYGLNQGQTVAADFQVFGNTNTLITKTAELVNNGSNGIHPFITAENLKDLPFTTQIISSGGNYNNLEITANLVVFTNENAQAIINGVKGRKDFHILNLSNTYEVRINHNSSSVINGAQPIMLPTASGNMGVKGTARILQTGGYGYYLADTWASRYRPEFTGHTETKAVVVNASSVAETRDIIEFIVFRDAQSVPMTKAELNAAYPSASTYRGFHVICNLINTTYRKIDNNSNDWDKFTTTTVL